MQIRLTEWPLINKIFFEQINLINFEKIFKFSDSDQSLKKFQHSNQANICIYRDHDTQKSSNFIFSWFNTPKKTFKRLLKTHFIFPVKHFKKGLSKGHIVK